MLHLNSSGFGRSIAAMLLGLAASGFGGKGPARSTGMIPRFLRPRNRYLPHQGKQECARRRRQIEAGFISTAGHKPRACIEDWKIEKLGGHTRLRGTVHGHPTVADGTQIVTSAVLLLGGERCETRNTVYRLGQPAV